MKFDDLPLVEKENVCPLTPGYEGNVTEAPL